MTTIVDGGAPDRPDDAVDALGDAVVALVRAWRGVARRAAEHHSPSSLAVLEMARLLGTGERRLAELAELRGVDQSVISRQIAELEQRGFVARRPDPHDRRACLVRLSDDGLAVLGHARSLRQAWLRTALAASPVDDVRRTAQLVAALATELRNQAEEIDQYEKGFTTA